MANLQNFGVTSGNPAQINVPTHVITATVDEGGEVIADYTGQNALRWPEVLATLSSEQQQVIADTVAQTVVLMKAGIG
jgi:hypothetical protein